MDEFLRGTYFVEDPFCRANVHLQMTLTGFEHIKLRTRFLVTFPIMTLLLSSLVSKVLKLVDTSHNMILLAELIPSIVTLGGSVLAVVLACFLKDRGIAILIRMVNDLKEERSEAEVAIKKVYERLAVLIVRTITVMGVLGLVGLVASLFIPHALDVILPINETRPRELPFHGEHFVDEEKYFYYIAFSQHLTCTAVVLVVESVENVSVISCVHLCSMMAVFGYKVENVVQFVYGSAVRNAVGYAERFTDKIRECCREYRKVSEMFTMLNYLAGFLIPFVLLVTFISFSMLLVTIMTIESIGVSNALFTFAAIVQFALVNFMGQYAVNESSKLQYHVYNTLWYNAPIRIQRMFLLMLMRTQKPFVISSAIFELSAGSFAAVVKTATSFCMVLKETQ